MRPWLRLSLVLYLFGFAFSCPLAEEPFGNVTADQDLEVGSTLKWRCSLFENQARKNNISVKNLSLEFRRRVLAVDIIDDYTIEYTVPSASVNDSGNYMCFVEHPDYDVKQLVCLSHVAVGHKPSDVKEFSCISLEYSNLTCKWKIPPNPVDTTYTLYDYFFTPNGYSGNGNLSLNCKRISQGFSCIINRTCPVKLNSSSCQFRLDTEPLYIRNTDKLHFILVGSNSLGTNKQYIDVDHYKIIKPGVPRFHICSNVTQNSLFMRWNAPKGLEYRDFPSGLLYQVKYYPLTSNLHNVKEIVTFSEDNLLITIKDLIPNTLYEFKVRVRLNISGDDYYWSNVAKHAEKTKPDVPYLAPEVTKSAFDVEVINGNRSITLYWKAVPVEHENGDDFGYAIRYHEYHVPFRYRREVTKTHNNWVVLNKTTSHTFDYMDLDSAYIFNIIPFNKVGNSSNETAIVVDKIEKLLQGPKDITVISFGQGNYSLSWKNPNEETTHFTVFWCQTLKNRPAKCDGSIEWLHTAKTMQKLLLPDHLTNYQFAVAANYNHQTSGMVWAPCIALYKGVRYKVAEVKLVKKNSTSLRVQWSLGCKAQEQVIHKYLIAYCPYEGKCGDPNWKCEMGWSNVTVLNSTEREYILGSLKPFTCYFSYIRVLTNSGWSEDSYYAYESTMPSAPSDSPRNVEAKSVPITPYSVEIELLFQRPMTPNGIITKYKVYYNQSLENISLLKEVRANEEVAGHYKVRIQHSVHYDTNYSVQVAACVNEACSALSTPVYIYTGISNPSVIAAPRIEVSESFVNITWEPPSLPNGPIDFYEVELCNNDTGEIMHYIVNSSTVLSLNRECDAKSSDTAYDIRVRAVNIEIDTFLYGEYSRPTKMVFCPSGDMMSVYLSIGIGIGAVLIIIIVCLGLYCGVHRCRKEYQLHKNIKIKLPLELETPFDNPLTSFDKLKNGLQIATPDSSIPSDRAYERLCSFAQEGNQINVAGWDAADTSSQRNNSGESNRSGLSSADTTRTLVSMDSSAEHADAESSDNSREDDADNKISVEGMVQLPDCKVQNGMVFSRCFMRPRPSNSPYSRSQNASAMPPYCQFSEIPNMALVKKFGDNQPLTDQNKSQFSPERFLENLFKINSEPSLYNSDSEEIIQSPSGTQAYSKVGLARSSTNLSENTMGYSRFGAVMNTSNVPNNPQIFSVFVPQTSQLPIFPLVATDKNALVPVNKNSVTGVQNSNHNSKDAYSKFGVANHANDRVNYVSVNNFHEEPSQQIVPFVRPVGTKNCSESFSSKAANNCGQKLPALEPPETGFPELDSADSDQIDLQLPEDDNDPRSLQEIFAEDQRFVPTHSEVDGRPRILPICNGEHFPASDNLVTDSDKKHSDTNGFACQPNDASSSFDPDVEQDKNDIWEGSLSEEDFETEDFTDQQDTASVLNTTMNNYVPVNLLVNHQISTNTPIQNCQT